MFLPEFCTFRKMFLQEFCTFRKMLCKLFATKNLKLSEIDEKSGNFAEF